MCPKVYVLQQDKPLQEALALQLQSSLCLLQPEKACTQQQSPSAAKFKKNPEAINFE